MFHMFHNLLHKLQRNNGVKNFERVHELFWYAHQQMMRRYELLGRGENHFFLMYQNAPLGIWGLMHI